MRTRGGIRGGRGAGSVVLAMQSTRSAAIERQAAVGRSRATSALTFVLMSGKWTARPRKVVKQKSRVGECFQACPPGSARPRQRCMRRERGPPGRKREDRHDRARHTHTRTREASPHGSPPSRPRPRRAGRARQATADRHPHDIRLDGTLLVRVISWGDLDHDLDHLLSHMSTHKITPTPPSRPE